MDDAACLGNWCTGLRDASTVIPLSLQLSRPRHEAPDTTHNTQARISDGSGYGTKQWGRGERSASKRLVSFTGSTVSVPTALAARPVTSRKTLLQTPSTAPSSEHLDECDKNFTGCLIHLVRKRLQVQLCPDVKVQLVATHLQSYKGMLA